MKITIEQDFDKCSNEQIAAWLARFREMFTPRQEPTPAVEHVVTDSDVLRAPVEAVNKLIENATGAAAEPEQAKRTRKPRADAGKPRGPYKTTGEPAASEPATGGGASAQAATAAAPAIPTQSAAPKAMTPAPESTPAAADPAKKLTHEDMRAELGRINKIAGLGMAGCQQFLTEYRTLDGKAVKRISDVPEAEFRRFIQLINERIARFEAEGK